MRIKSANDLNIQLDPKNIQTSKKYQSKTYKVTVITPILGGGVEAGKPDTTMPIRASAIKGQLRYWWRFLKTQQYFNEHQMEIDQKELFIQERDVWGGSAEKVGDEKASRILVRCEVTKNTEKYKYAGKAPQYALFVAREERQTPAKDLIREGVEFDLTISYQSAKNESDTFFKKEVEPALRWWASFGGIGARTRRGLGTVKVVGLPAIAPEEAKARLCDLRVNEATDASKAMDKCHRLPTKIQARKRYCSKRPIW